MELTIEPSPSTSTTGSYWYVCMCYCVTVLLCHNQISFGNKENVVRPGLGVGLSGVRGGVAGNGNLITLTD